jgi:hypothetical protein
MNNIFDTLEICLQELEDGADLEAVLSRYPDLAAELRPILNASMMARTMAAPAPSPEAVRRGRAKLLQRASEMREGKTAPTKRMIPIFQRLAISFTLTAFFLASGTGLVGASSKALPGENLYPVKRSWEDVRLFFTFNPNRKESLASEFESERLNEVSELLTEGRDETIQFAGIFKQVNGITYVSGFAVLLPTDLKSPADGAPVVITGKTNAQGFVEIESIQELPEGSVVPVGEPIEGDHESNSNSGSGSEDGANSNSGSASESGAGLGSGNETHNTSEATATPKSELQSFEVNGTLASVSSTSFVINGLTYYFDIAKIDGVLKPGAVVEVKGYYSTDGKFIVTEVKVKDSVAPRNSNGGNGNEGSSAANSNSGSNSNENESSDSNGNSNDDNGGGGGNGNGG